jgi:hypothetical protein
MKALISLLMIAGVVYVAVQLYSQWEETQRKNNPKTRGASPEKTGPPAGLPAKLEPSLEAARKQGAAGLRNWLAVYSPYVQDPRRASIELDYVVLLAREDPAEAKRLFARIKQRVPPDSPVYERIKQLERTYE